MTLILALFLTVFAFTDSKNKQSIIAIIFASWALHDVISSHLDDSLYYLSAVIVDTAAIYISSRLIKPIKLLVIFHNICLALIFANVAGWVIWLSYLEPTIYDLSIVIIYAYALIMFTLIGGDDDIMGNISHNNDGSSFCRANNSSNR